MSDAFDRRLTPARPDLAAEHLRGRIAAGRYAPGRLMRVVADVLPVSPAPARDVPIDTQALYGEAVTVYETDDEGWAWGQLAADGYVGYMPAEGLRSADAPATHRVHVLRTIVYPAPTMKMPLESALFLGAQVRVAATTGDFAQVPGLGFVFAAHLRPLDDTEPDFVSVAERFEHAPYLWGGRTVGGIDCSGLVQAALAASGRAAPRDTDLQQAALGEPLTFDDRLDGLQRGDLVFWKGHVGLLRDATTLLHANGHHMLVVSEPLVDARDRILAKSHGPITAIRRP